MRKTDKKKDNQVRLVLTSVCESALKDFVGFQWLTHLVNYTDFPKSLKVVCVFDTNDNLNSFMENNCNHRLNALIQKKFSDIDISVNNIANHISYDTEEDCEKNNNGKWPDRISSRSSK
jgi:hypothetical protein